MRRAGCCATGAVMVDDPSRFRATPPPPRATLAAALGVAVEALATEPVPGRVHDHWRFTAGGRALMLRIPQLSHLGLPLRSALRYEAQAFRRAAHGEIGTAACRGRGGTDV